jgi:hypothetical protein
MHPFHGIVEAFGVPRESRIGKPDQAMTIRRDVTPSYVYRARD